MVDRKLSELDTAGALSGTELIEILQSGDNVTVTLDEVAEFAGDVGGGGGGGGMVPAYIDGDWHHALGGCQFANGSALAANTIKLHPVYIPEAMTISELGAYMSTNAAAQNVQYAIYARNPATGNPTGTALGSTPNISTAGAAGPLAGALSVPAAIATPGIYFFAINSSSGTPVFTVISTADSTIAWLLGSTALAHIWSAQLAPLFIYSVATQAFGTWPDLTGASFSKTGSTSAWAVLAFKVASTP